jgi:uncharacterized membrane protein (UPF0127 family)
MQFDRMTRLFQLSSLPVGRLIAVLLLLLVARQASATDADRLEIVTRTGTHSFSVELALTNEERGRGLMHRMEMDEDAGMLFRFDGVRPVSMWMKNTFIPLDMIFVGTDGRVVGVHARAKPHSLAPISIGHPSRWVIEVPGGWAEKAGVAVGDRVELLGVGGPPASRTP